jgi:hypothetical protein
MNPPVITAIDLSGYQGRPGNRIRIQATDDFAVVAVRVLIRTSDAQLLAELEAALQPDGSWQATPAVACRPGQHLEVLAFDHAGNQARAVREL